MQSTAFTFAIFQLAIDLQVICAYIIARVEDFELQANW